jgi:hypothetical protein
VRFLRAPLNDKGENPIPKPYLEENDFKRKNDKVCSNDDHRKEISVLLFEQHSKMFTGN